MMDASGSLFSAFKSERGFLIQNVQLGILSLFPWTFGIRSLTNASSKTMRVFKSCLSVFPFAFCSSDLSRFTSPLFSWILMFIVFSTSLLSVKASSSFFLLRKAFYERPVLEGYHFNKINQSATQSHLRHNLPCFHVQQWWNKVLKGKWFIVHITQNAFFVWGF